MSMFSTNTDKLLKKASTKLSTEQKIKLIPSISDMNTSQAQMTLQYMEMIAQVNPLLRKKFEEDGSFCQFREKNNYDLIKKGIIPDEKYFKKFNFYLDAIINYFIEKINIEHSELKHKQWWTARNAIYNMFYFGRVIVRYNEKDECYETLLPTKLEVDKYGYFASGSGIHIGAINNMFGFVQNQDYNNYKNEKVNGEDYAYGTINKWSLGFLYMLREMILTTIYFESKTENVALLESVKAYEQVGDLSQEGYFENQIKNEDKIVIKKLNIMNNPVSDKLEIMDYKTGDKLQSLTGYVDWRDSRLATWIGYRENQTKNKQANLLIAEVEGTEDLQENRLEHWYDSVKMLFDRVKEISPSSPIQLRKYEEVKKEAEEQTDEEDVDQHIAPTANNLSIEKSGSKE